jgi:hypothetical protein
MVMVMSKNMRPIKEIKEETGQEKYQDNQGEKCNSQAREYDMTDVDDEVIIQPINHPRWQTSVEQSQMH